MAKDPMVKSSVIEVFGFMNNCLKERYTRAY